MKQLFECAETSQALLDVFFRVCCDYFSTSTLLLFTGDAARVQRVHGSSLESAVGARVALGESAALAPLRAGGDLGAAAVSIEAGDALIASGAWPAPSDALVLPLVIRGRTAAAVVGEGRLLDGPRRDILAITATASAALAALIARRAASAKVSDATQILTAPLRDERSKRDRKLGLIAAAAGTGLVLLVAILVWLFGGSRSPAVVASSDLPGSPRVDPIELVGTARTVSRLGDRAELIAIRAIVGADGRTNLAAPAVGAESPIEYVFGSGDDIAHVRVEQEGIYPPVNRPRGVGQRECGTCGCDVAAPPPSCALRKIVEAARAVGLGADESAVATYSFCTSQGPRWTVSVPGRGEVTVSDTSCAALPREVLPPPARKLESIPGAPHGVNPFQLIADARRQSGLPEDSVLVRVEAWFVASNGLVDVRAPLHRGRIEWLFADPPADAGAVRMRRVVLDDAGMSMRATEQGVAPPVPIPRCTVEKLWRATAAEAPQGALAHILYEADPADSKRPTWTLELAGGALHQVRTDTLCAAWE